MTEFAFRAFPVGVTAMVSRPIVDLVIAGVEHAPQAFLIDTGATAIRMSVEIGEALGIDLDDGQPRRLAVGGGTVDGTEVTVSLALDLDGERLAWEAPVTFCSPWTPAFGLLGLRGFLDCFDLTLSGQDERFALTSRLEG